MTTDYMIEGPILELWGAGALDAVSMTGALFPIRLAASHLGHVSGGLLRPLIAGCVCVARQAWQ